MDTLITATTMDALTGDFVTAAGFIIPAMLAFLAFRKIRGLIKSV